MPLPFLRAPLLETFSNLSHGFTTRQGGVSEGAYRSLNLGWASDDSPTSVKKNYSLFSQKVQISMDRFIFMNQVHGDHIVLIEEEDPLEKISNQPADGLITRRKQIFLMVRIADCLPILLVDPLQKALGCIHAGWRGTVAKILSKAIQKMEKEFSTQPENLLMAIGPGIGVDHFQVSSDVLSEFQRKVGIHVDEMQNFNGFPHLDLAKINSRIAREQGIRLENIWISKDCTMCDSHQFFSYRRDGKNSGRMVGWIGWLS